MVGSGFSHLAGIAGDNCYVVSQRCDGPRHAAVAGWMVTIGLFDPSRLAGGVRPFGCDGRGQLDMTRTHSSQPHTRSSVAGVCTGLGATDRAARLMSCAARSG